MTETDSRPEAGRNNGRKRVALTIFGLLAAIGVAGGIAYRGHLMRYVSTDDAFVEGPIHLVSSRIQGVVRTIRVETNQIVQAGDLLAEIEPEILDARAREAEAAMGVEKNRQAELRARLLTHDSRIRAAEAAYQTAIRSSDQLAAAASARRAEAEARRSMLIQAERNLKRAGDLSKGGIVPSSAVDDAATARETAAAGLRAADEIVRQAEAAIETSRSGMAQAEAALKTEIASRAETAAAIERQSEEIRRDVALLDVARLNQGYTRILAPAGGQVTRRNVEVGNHLQPGQPILAIVPIDRTYIVANLKETQVGGVRPGQPVSIEVDAYPGESLSGRVESVMAGTGSAFSLFPPENASGNFVKVVQRVPVKIVLDEKRPADRPLRIGMSVIPTIDISSRISSH